MVVPYFKFLDVQWQVSIHGDEYLCILIMHSPKPHLRLQDHEKILLHVYDDKINNVSIILQTIDNQSSQ